MPEGPPRRIFVVGCPRSGTTLLQSLLAAHPDIHAFAETHALRELESLNPFGRRVGLRRRGAADVWRGLPDIGVPVERRPPRLVGAYVRGLATALDRATVASGRAAWAEKTPGHLRSLHLVDRHLPDARVIHVVRQGVPTVASLLAVTHGHPEAWGGERSVELCMTRWRNDLRRTAAWAGHPHHVVVGYESLVDEPERVLTSLLDRVELSTGADGVRTMVGGYARRAADVRAADEPWKDGVTRPLANRNDIRVEALADIERQVVVDAVEACQDVYAELPFI